MSTEAPAPGPDVRLLRLIIEVTSADLDVAEISQRVAALVTEATGSDVCFVHLVDEDRRRVVLAGATPPFDDLVGEIELAMGEGIAGWVALNARPAVVPDKWSDRRYRYIPALRGEDFASMVSVPMLTPRNHQVVGVLNIHSRLPRAYGEADLDLLTQVANLMARTIDNARLYRRLAEREAQLEGFAARTVEAQENERRRLAGDIHDGISQRLVSLWYHLLAAEDAASAATDEEAAGTDAAGAPGAESGVGGVGVAASGGVSPDRPVAGTADVLRRELAVAKDLTTAALEEARAAIGGLRPTMLDDLGLGPSIESLARSLPVGEVQLDLRPVDLPPHVEVAVYRIAQEALQNVVKHAGATSVLVRLGTEAEGVRLVVADDGRGFDGEPIPGEGSRPSYGMGSIRERAELIGAQLSLESHPGKGTTLELLVPTA